MTGNVSRETMERLATFRDLVIRWNSRINLVAPSTISEFDSRHIEDCLQISKHVSPESGIWADLGSGGGLPGIVLAIVFSNHPVQFRLLESDQRKAAFLRTVIRELTLENTQVYNRRIEDADPLNAAYLSARALAPLPRLMPYLDRHLAKYGQAWIMKGENWREEVEDARHKWKFNVFPIQSTSRPGAAILKISEVTDAKS
ncbi:16S rRNA (guanine(527)-N(7))-methyltransferase RsmG [Paracoccus onubensis]|uniref:Ribosomal RNA small subunit methyltransferase G n=1 Tax=Paracoccus onubensis TaxID=1675788 RepID=A0A418SR47_9RHOB|nr:16S rRNA (guanine(527)-N(7))-methyltransferase RsmG [Paracoccus onubensis]RJE83451.1 16S rRNA (guanine(527)-N(7))-methyltransferase RsmG [Paracoccus onubensis]